MFVVVWTVILVLAAGLSVWARRRARGRNLRLAESGFHDTSAGTLRGSPRNTSSVGIETAVSAHPPTPA